MSGRRLRAVPELIPFGQHIKQLRKDRKLSQEEVALAADMDRSYLSGIENGKRNPTVTQLYKLANGLSLHPSKLFEL